MRGRSSGAPPSSTTGSSGLSRAASGCRSSWISTLPASFQIRALEEVAFLLVFRARRAARRRPRPAGAPSRGPCRSSAGTRGLLRRVLDGATDGDEAARGGRGRTTGSPGDLPPNLAVPRSRRARRRRGPGGSSASITVSAIASMLHFCLAAGAGGFFNAQSPGFNQQQLFLEGPGCTRCLSIAGW